MARLVHPRRAFLIRARPPRLLAIGGFKGLQYHESPMTVFLTGATGFLGGVLAGQLVAAGHAVHALVRSPDKAARLNARGVRLFRGDISRVEPIRAAMTGADAVFHVAGWYKVGVRDRSEAFLTNVDGTRNVLSTMRDLGVKKGVYTSTLAVNSDTRGRVVDEDYRFTGRHISVYDRSKADAHDVALSFIAQGLPLVIVQPGLIYGPGDTSGVRTMLREYLLRKMPLVPARTAFAWGHVEDIARAHVLALEKGRPGRNYFASGPVHTLDEALRLAAAITGIPAPRLRVNPVVLRAASAAMTLIEKVVPLSPAYSSEGLRVIAGVTYLGSHARARRELGWTARPLRDGLTETLRHEMTLLGLSPRF
jgi:nucleoside-diphosphate-sugar epimerase